MELLAMFSIYCMLFFAAALMAIAALGILLLIDLICKTNFGRRVFRWIFCEEVSN